METNDSLRAEMQKNMQEAQSQREWREVLIDIKQELPEDIKDVEPINVGLEPAKGFYREKMSGREREKKRCEDRKIKDPEHGLFMIADGVSTGEGSTAAELTSRFVQGRLGEPLDKKIANLKASGKATVEMVNDLVAREIQRAVHEADAAVKRIQQKDRAKYGGTNSTPSVAKLVELPGGGQRMFFANLGDSRIHLKRGDRFMRLTRDDSQHQIRMEKAVSRGNLTMEEARGLDQFMDKSDFSPAQKEIDKGRATITAHIGGSEKARNLPYEPEVAGLEFFDEESDEEFWAVNQEESAVRWIDVQPGDKIVVTSDGPHDNLTERQMNNLIDRFPGDDAAERAIQGTAVNMMRADQDRSKPDDASIVVHEIGESRPESFEPERAPAEARPYTKEQAQQWPEQLSEIDRQLLSGRREIVRLEKGGGDPIELLQAERALNGLEQQRANLEHWMARAEADQIKDELPHRFEPGTAVDMASESGAGRGGFEVRAYDVSAEEYVVAQPNKPPSRIPRLQLERHQPGLKLKFDDILPLPVTGPDGMAKREEGFRVLGYSEDGKVLFERASEQAVDRYVIAKDTATRYMQERIAEGAQWEDTAEAKLRELETLKAESAELQKALDEAERQAILRKIDARPPNS